MAKNSKPSKNPEPVRKTLYFSEDDLDLLEFLENQNETLSKFCIRLIREYKQRTVNNQDIFNKTEMINSELIEMKKLLSSEFQEIKKMLYYRPVDPSSINLSALTPSPQLQEKTTAIPEEKNGKDSFKYNLDLSGKDLDTFE